MVTLRLSENVIEKGRKEREREREREREKNAQKLCHKDRKS